MLLCSTTAATLEWRRHALDSAGIATTEEDPLTELLGREDADDVETEQPWLRVDSELHASVPIAHPIPMPRTAARLAGRLLRVARTARVPAHP